MNYKHNINYFQNGEGLKILGAAMAIVGGVVFYFGWSYISYILSCIAIPAGLFLFFWSTGTRSSDKDLEEEIDEICADVKIRWEDDKKLSARRRKNIEPLVVRGYEYQKGLLLKKTKNGSLRTSRYTVAEIAVLEDAVYLTTKSFSLIADDCEDQTIEITLSDLRSVELQEEEKQFSYQKATVRITDRRLVFRYGENNLLSFPINNDLNVEHFVEQLQNILQKSI